MTGRARTPSGDSGPLDGVAVLGTGTSDPRIPGTPIHFSRTPTSVRQHPSPLGEHTEEILQEYGYESADVERLRAADALGD